MRFRQILRCTQDDKKGRFAVASPFSISLTPMRLRRDDFLETREVRKHTGNAQRHRDLLSRAKVAYVGIGMGGSNGEW